MIFFHIEKIKVNIPHIIQKIYLLWTIELNVRTKSIKLLKGNIKDNFHDLVTGKVFLVYKSQKL